MRRPTILFFLICSLAADANSFLRPSALWEIHEATYFVERHEVSDDPFLKSTLSDFWLAVNSPSKEVLDSFLELTAGTNPGKIISAQFNLLCREKIPLFILHLKFLV